MQKILKHQLGITLETTFTEFTKRPIASATIAQVHLGRLRKSNEKVAVKIQHPGSSDLMISDIRNMLYVSIFMDTVGFKPPFDHTGVLREYAQQVRSLSSTFSFSN